MAPGSPEGVNVGILEDGLGESGHGDAGHSAPLRDQPSALP